MSLVLSRKEGQIICIGDDIKVEFVSIHNGQVKVAITAPRNVSIDREEVRIRKDAEKGSADEQD